MNTENTKTLCVHPRRRGAVGRGLAPRPAPPPKSDVRLVGKKLFADFKDPTAVDSLKVVQFDQQYARPLAFEVAKSGGAWVIPSHGNYPADAKEHLAAAANSLMGLNILGLAPGFDPGSPPLDARVAPRGLQPLRRRRSRPGLRQSSDSGLGTRITMKDAAGHELAAAIIGKTLPDQTDQCYIRKVVKDAAHDKDPVYIVQLDPSKLSVKFSDWIEPNLLNLNSMDLKQIRIHDYTVNLMLDPASNQIVLERLPKGEFLLDLPSRRPALEAGRPAGSRAQDPEDGLAKAGGRRGTEHRHSRRPEDGPGRPENRRRGAQAGARFPPISVSASWTRRP